ncbi:MAG: hypothetical protein QOI73_326 [Solirubrobacteraceae bacterium]|nr:hypothetical protein [Solirubrobacteraceae bacterium]
MDRCRHGSSPRAACERPEGSLRDRRSCRTCAAVGFNSGGQVPPSLQQRMTESLAEPAKSSTIVVVPSVLELRVLTGPGPLRTWSAPLHVACTVQVASAQLVETAVDVSDPPLREIGAVAVVRAAVAGFGASSPPHPPALTAASTTRRAGCVQPCIRGRRIISPAADRVPLVHVASGGAALGARAHSWIVTGVPASMRSPNQLMDLLAKRTQPCEEALPSAPGRMPVPCRAICPGPPSNSR